MYAKECGRVLVCESQYRVVVPGVLCVMHDCTACLSSGSPLTDKKMHEYNCTEEDDKEEERNETRNQPHILEFDSGKGQLFLFFFI